MRKNGNGPRVERWRDRCVRCSTCGSVVQVKDIRRGDELIRDTQCRKCHRAFRYRYVRGRCIEGAEMETLEFDL